jgi:TonB family protein
MSPATCDEIRKPNSSAREMEMQLKADKGISSELCRFVSRSGVILALLALALLPVRPARAADLEKQVKFDYLEKVLTLRHFYSGEHLKFQSDGTLQGDAPIGPWTLDGQIEVEDVHLHGAQLVIKGRRIHRTFDAQHNSQDLLTIVGNSPNKQQKKLARELRHLQVEIEIELPRENPDENDVASAIHPVFLTNSESMMDIVPAYWQSYFAKLEGNHRPPHPPIGPVYRVQPGKVSAPHINYQPDPAYSDEAREAKYQGTLVLYLVVDASGVPRDLQIMEPLGLGLDERAIAAVSTWKFEPGQKDGEPVSVAINVQVSFRLY